MSDSSTPGSLTPASAAHASSARPILPVILSGGSGTRLWPLSRETYPKQFLKLTGERSLIQETAQRVPPAAGFLPPLVIANESHRFLVSEQLAEIGVGSPRIVLEPVGRNSAPAVAIAALIAAEADPETIVLVLAADAHIADAAGFRDAIHKAAVAARLGRIVTLGMDPTRPETGYGYIRKGAAVAGAPGVSEVAAFVEKPDRPRAEALLAEGCLWNAGLFLFTARTMLDELEAFAPDVLEAARDALEVRGGDLEFIRLGESAFRRAPSISIDYAVMEKTKRAAVLPAQVGWSDVGAWDALLDILPTDRAGNVAVGDVHLIDTERSYVRSDENLTVLIGLSDVVVVNTGDAVLVASRDRAQDVKLAVDALKKAGRPEAREHRRMYRPWGFYEGLIQGERFQVKRIVVRPGARLSLQKHFHRAEHWVVVNGTAQVVRDGEMLLLRENESVYLPLGAVHRLENPGKIPLTLIEVQSGAYLGEDDIVRLEDTYGRV